jgi:uncharacterized protein DUF4167
MSEMTPQSNSNGRSRPRPNFACNTRPAQAGQQNAPNNQSQWQRKYDHYCNLTQATDSNDAVTREHYWQHAEHFLRLMHDSAS